MGAMAVSSFMVPLGTPAPGFDLPAIDGSRLTLDDLKDSPALLVIFLSNHCPYVRRIEFGVADLVADYDGRLHVVAVGSNDPVAYPADDRAHLREQAVRAGFTFPYLLDEDQEAAKAYRAACTPDFFLYDAERLLVYRGEFDGARPANDLQVTGGSLRPAVDAVLDGRVFDGPQRPSLGCSIKWRPGNEPA
jgi:peroxiredoxin